MIVKGISSRKCTTLTFGGKIHIHLPSFPLKLHQFRPKTLLIRIIRPISTGTTAYLLRKICRNKLIKLPHFHQSSLPAGCLFHLYEVQRRLMITATKMLRILLSLRQTIILHHSPVPPWWGTSSQNFCSLHLYNNLPPSKKQKHQKHIKDLLSEIYNAAGQENINECREIMTKV